MLIPVPFSNQLTLRTFLGYYSGAGIRRQSSPWAEMNRVNPCFEGKLMFLTPETSLQVHCTRNNISEKSDINSNTMQLPEDELYISIVTTFATLELKFGILCSPCCICRSRNINTEIHWKPFSTFLSLSRSNVPTNRQVSVPYVYIS